MHNCGLQYLMVLDEAQVLLPAEADKTDDGIATLAHLLQQREMGVGCVVVVPRTVPHITMLY